MLPPDFNELERVARKAALAIKSSSGASYSVGNSAKLLYAASGILINFVFIYDKIKRKNKFCRIIFLGTLIIS